MSVFDQPAGSPAFGFNQIGARVQGYVVAEPTVKPQMKFDGSGKPTDIPDTWTSGDPKMKVIIQLQTQFRDPENEDDDGIRAIYAVISNSEGSCFRAIKDAIKAAGRKDIEIGGFLDVWYAADDPKSSNPRNPRKMYGAQYQPPATPLAAQEPPAPPAAAAPPQQYQPPAAAPQQAYQPPQQAYQPPQQAYQPPQQAYNPAGMDRAAQVQQAQAHFPNAPQGGGYPPADVAGNPFAPQAPTPGVSGVDFAAMAAAMNGAPPAAAPAAAPVAAPPVIPTVEIDPATVEKVRALLQAGIDLATITAATGVSEAAVKTLAGLG